MHRLVEGGSNRAHSSNQDCHQILHSMQYAEKLNADKLKKVIHGLSGACLPRLLAPAAWRATTHPSCMLLLCAACGSLPVKTEGQEPPC